MSDTIELYSAENREIQRFWPDWKIESQIGRGSFGVVYKAVRHDYNLVNYSAIKIISIPKANEYEQLKSEFTDEQTLTKYLNSIADSCINEIELMISVQGTENIVNIHDYKRVPKADSLGWDIYIRMELLTPFNEYAQSHVLDEFEVRQVGIDICKALEKCGKQHIIHRDIKPENIFRSIDGKFKLGDFGIAKKMENMVGSLSHKGTEFYMAPEVFTASNYDSRVDIYSLGIVLYKLLNNNCHPFLTAETHTDPIQREISLRKRIQGARLPAPKNASPEMSKIILKACEHDVTKRYSSAAEMRKAMEAMQVGTLTSKRKTNWKLLICLLLGLAAAAVVGIFAPKIISKIKDNLNNSAQTSVDTEEKLTPDVDVSLAVPNVVGATEEIALEIFRQNGLAEPIIERKEDSSVEAGKVISQNVDAYENVTNKTIITLVISSGPAMFKMPFVENMDYSEAKKILEEQGLVVVPHFQKDDSVAENMVISQNVDPDTEVKAGDTVELIVSSGKALVTVKNVAGKTTDTAKAELEGQGFEVNVVEAYNDSVAKGKVISQNPYADSSQPDGATITITVSLGVETVSVPNVYKLTEAKAKSTLTTAGFKVKTTYKNDSGIANGSVISQDPKADSKVAKGSEITIVVNSGKKLVTVPDLYNKTEQEAKSALEKLGLKVTVVTDYSNDVDEGRVCAQSVSGKQVEEGSTVTITISKGANTVTVSFDSNGGSSCNSIKVTVGGTYGSLPTPTRDFYTFMGWFNSNGTPVTGTSKVPGSNHTLTAEWNLNPLSGWVKASAVPSGASIEERKYTYTKTSTTTSSSSTMNGWTLYDTKTEWSDYGAWSAWSDTKYTKSESREIETKQVISGYEKKTQYRYSRWVNAEAKAGKKYNSGARCYPYKSSGGCIYEEYTDWMDEPFMVRRDYGSYLAYGENGTYDSQGLEWYNQETREVDDTTKPIYKTQYRYRDRSKVYTYYFKKEEYLESVQMPSGSGISNVVEYVRYRAR